MNKWKLLMAGITAFSILLNAIFAGVAVRIWLRSSDGSRPIAVLSTLPGELRSELRSEISQADSQIATAQAALEKSRRNLQSLLGADEPNLQALQLVLANVRENTARLQTELHAVILKFYTTTSQW